MDGGAEDVGDITFINTFGIPIEMRVFTNVTSDSTQYYQIGGYTNTNSANTTALISNLVSTFSNALWYNTNGSKAAVVLGPSANAGPGILLPYTPPGGYTATTPVAWPLFTNYFAAVAANSSRTNVIGDMISLPDNAGGDGSWDFFYSFNLSITNVPLSNSLVLSGSLTVTNNSRANTSTNAGKSQTFNNLVLTLAGDSGGPTDNWASWAVYLAPTPSGFTYRTNPASAPWNDTLMAISTNTSYSWVPLSAQGQPVLALSNTGSDTWAAVYSFVGPYSPGDHPNATSSTALFYQTDFGKKVIGRIMGDLAAGFALGFINSDVTNSAYTNSAGLAQRYGDSPSGAWWGGISIPTPKRTPWLSSKSSPATRITAPTAPQFMSTTGWPMCTPFMTGCRCWGAGLRPRGHRSYSCNPAWRPPQTRRFFWPSFVFRRVF